MSLARTGVIFGEELARTFKRPLFWFLVVLLVLMTWGLSTGHMQIALGRRLGGRHQGLGHLGVRLRLRADDADGAALRLLRLDRRRHGGDPRRRGADRRDAARDAAAARASTSGGSSWRSSPASWASSASTSLLTIFFNHVAAQPGGARRSAARSTLANYLRPALVFGLPTLVFYLGVAFFLGERWRRPVTVFLFPIAAPAGCGFFLWSWAPTWLDPRINRLLMLVDPAGFRWLNETWIKLDRGAGFYNTARVGLDLPFVLSRLAFLALGLAGVWLAQRHLAAHLRGRPGADAGAAAADERSPTPPGAAGRRRPLPALAELGMRSRPVGLVRGHPGGGRHGAAEPALLARPLPVRRPDPAADPGRRPDRPGAVPDPAADHPGPARGADAMNALDRPPLPAPDVLHRRVAGARARDRPRADLLLDAGAHRLAPLRQGARQQRGRRADGRWPPTSAAPSPS